MKVMDEQRHSLGQLLATVATVNDLHLGERVCGVLAGVDIGPPLQAEPGAEPYPQVMSRAVVSEIAAISPDVVVAKGDLTATGSASEYAEFESLYRQAFGARLVETLGNHDKPAGGGDVPPAPSVQAVDLPGVTLAVLDTARPGRPGGQVSPAQCEWLDETARSADRPVMVFGHHPPDGPDMHLFGPQAAEAACLDRDSTERLAGVVVRRPGIVGYFAGHTHRNKRRLLSCTGDFPWVEVACVKDFPGSWAEYRIHEAGVVQVHHRVSSDPDALRWSERCRAMFAGYYPVYAWGEPGDRSFTVPVRPGGRPV